MKNVVIIDDEPLAHSIIEEYLANYSNVKILAICNNGYEGLKAIQHHQPDLIFLDIQMPKITGFEMLELLENPPAVIFTTAFDEYAIQAFETNAIDYLLKPFSKERFDKAMHRWATMAPAEQQEQQAWLQSSTQLSTAQQERIVVKQGPNIKIIAVNDVIYFEAADDYVKLHTADGYFLKNKTMAYFEKLLSPQQFVRVHRSYIVAVKNINRIDPYEKESFVALLKQGQRVPVSKAGYTRLREVLGL